MKNRVVKKLQKEGAKKKTIAAILYIANKFIVVQFSEFCNGFCSSRFIDEKRQEKLQEKQLFLFLFQEERVKI